MHPCKSAMFDLAGRSGEAGGRELSNGTVTHASERLITSVGFSVFYKVLLDGKLMRDLTLMAKM